MGPDYLEEKFPDMRPVNKPPGMFTLNGIGTTVYGKRDWDDETATYVKTLVFTIIFIPIFAISSYRVADGGDEGWYFIGKVPLSGFAKGYNYLVGAVLALALVGGGVGSYFNSAEYKAGERMEKAATLAEQGDYASAAAIYGDVVDNYRGQAGEARDELTKLATTRANEMSLADASIVLEHASRSSAVPGDTLSEKGLSLLEEKATDDPKAAIALFKTIDTIAPGTDVFLERRRKLLESLVDSHPKEVAFASQLAVDYERTDECDGCEELLAPHADKLGATEGARILGQIYAARGDFDNAYNLLEPYTNKHLQAFRKASEDYERTLDTVQEQILSQLDMGMGPQSFYDAYEAADEAGKQVLVGEYINEKLEANARYKAARSKLEKRADVVPVALDLGIATLNRAQTLPTQAARDAGLEKAKRTFLSVRSVAANSAQYQLYLGQVHYWLGEHDQGKQQFDSLLASANREPMMLIQVAHALREVGLHSEARSLAEEAYESAEEGDEAKSAAASLRALTSADLDDRIKWHKRTDQNVAHNKASLAGALADQALRKGDKQEAERQLRKEIGIYAEQVESPGTLNNAALAMFKLYEITGDDADFEKGSEMMDKALALAPSDSVVVWNIASTYLSAGVRDLLGPSVDLQGIGERPSLSYLSYLYKNASERDRYIAKLDAHPAIAESLKAMDRARVLSPKANWIYGALFQLHYKRNDIEGLESLAKKLSEIELNVEDYTQQTRDHWAGTSDPQTLADFAAQADELDQTLDGLSERRQRVEFAIAANIRADIEVLRASMGAEADLDKAVRLAERAYKLSPSTSTLSARRNAHVSRAVDTFAKDNSKFGTLCERYRRTIGDHVLFVLALDDAEMRKALLSNKDARAVVELTEQSSKAFPQSGSTWEWAVMRRVDEEKAAAYKQRLLEDRRSQLKIEISQKLEPLSADWAYNKAWLERAKGNDAEADAVLKTYAERGLPMPL